MPIRYPSFGSHGASGMPTITTISPVAPPIDAALADTPLTLEKRVAGLEMKAQFDGELIAKQAANLSQCGQIIDAMMLRIDSLGKRVAALEPATNISAPPTFAPAASHGEVATNAGQ